MARSANRSKIPIINTAPVDYGNSLIGFSVTTMTDVEAFRYWQRVGAMKLFVGMSVIGGGLMFAGIAWLNLWMGQ